MRPPFQEGNRGPPADETSMQRDHLDRREFLGHGLSAVALLIGGARTTPRVVARARRRLPNIVFVMADDLGLGDLRVYDPTSRIPTPNVDHLARGGIRFRDAHAPAALCTPTRYSVLTGRYPFRSRLRDGVLYSAYDEPVLEADTLTLPELLRRQGYHTAAVGKWHLGNRFSNRAGDGFARPGVESSGFTTRDVDFTKPILDGPLNHGFDYFFGLASALNHDPYTFVENDRVTVLPDHFRPQRDVDGQPVREGWAAPGWDEAQVGEHLLDKALDFITQHVQTRPDQPFFLYYPEVAPHFPHVPPIAIHGHAVKGQGGSGCGAPARCDMVVQLDVVLGEILKRLADPKGSGRAADSIADDTLVVLTSDNGTDEGSYAPLREGKGRVYEGGVRVPFIASWPGRIPAGVVSDEVIGLNDMYATFAAAAGAALPAGAAIDSENVLRALLGRRGAGPVRGPLVVQGASADTLAVREGRWKLIVKSDEPVELYDLKADLKESINVLSRNQAVAERLLGALREIRRRN
jgi:arylsulfatase A